MDQSTLLHMAWPDVLIIGVYLVGIVGLGLLAWSKRKRRQNTSAEYFLAGTTLRWPLIGLALFSTNISTTHLVSLAQEGYVNGLAISSSSAPVSSSPSPSSNPMSTRRTARNSSGDLPWTPSGAGCPSASWITGSSPGSCSPLWCCSILSSPDKEPGKWDDDL